MGLFAILTFTAFILSGILFYDFAVKRMNLQAQKPETRSADLARRIELLEKSNAKLKEQVENLQAIMIDHDMAQLSSGFKSETIAFEKENDLNNLNEDELYN